MASQPLFLDIHIIAQWAHELSGHGGRDGVYARTQQQELPLTVADLATAVSECQISQEQRTTLNPDMAPFSRVSSQQPSNG